ncbi:MAG: DUF4393 domain-containing protein [Verrucomicrobiaceae bacterium]|nr:MAG: DUF4393 domain-containing protein [Verrucomicrobiaceae bacterium]
MDEKDSVTLATEVTKAVAVEIYTDLAKPAAHEAGEAIGTVIGLFNNVVLHPLKRANIHFKYKLEEFRNELNQKLEAVPLNQIRTPELVIAGPTIEALRYTIDAKDLREMYLNLLVTSMNAKTANEAHPSFVTIIKEMSPQDAVLFSTISNSREQILTHCLHKLPNRHPETILNQPAFYVPTLEGDPFFNSKSLQNLERLGLLTNRSHTNWGVIRFEHCDEFIRHQASLATLPHAAPSSVMVLSGTLSINDFGKSFAAACLPPPF